MTSWDRTLSALRGGPPVADDPADQQRAVLFSSPWQHAADGWAIATRAYARAMHEAGLKVRLRDWHGGERADENVLQEMAVILRDQPKSWGLHVFSSTLASAAKMDVLDALLDNVGPQTYYCVFERRHIEPALVEKLNRLRGIWVQCQMNRTVLLRAGVKNVTLIPYPYFDDDPHLTLPPRNGQPRRFYYIGRFEPRKSPDNIIRAFLRAFKPGESELTIKTSPIPHTLSNYPTAKQIVLQELRENEVREQGWDVVNWNRSIWIVEEKLSAEQMLKLHAESDIYVSSSRGEGLDLPIWAAKLSGRRIITTASGGPEDFLDPETDIIVPANRLIPADPCYKWGPGANYIDYELDDLVVAMRRARWAPKPGTRTWPYKHQHSSAEVAKCFNAWVEEMLS